jgi:hypothetical protein
MLRELQIHRWIIEDLTVTTLAFLPGLFPRLVYLAALRDPGEGRYQHERLAAVYNAEAVQQALATCHEEIFERLLETPLALQEADLRRHLEAAPGGLSASLTQWQRRELQQSLIPEQAPDYLKELFCSNVRALLEILQPEGSTVHSNA